MGTLHAGNHSFVFDDRTLAHLRVAFALQLEGTNGFFLSWNRPVSEGSGSISLWVSSSETIVFEFLGNREARINRAWVNAIRTSTGGGAGLKLVPEPREHAAGPRAESSSSSSKADL